MKKKKKKSLKIKNNTIKHDFDSHELTSYSGLKPISGYLHNVGIIRFLEENFPTDIQNATKFSTAQVLSAVVLASLAGVSRQEKIAHFTADPLVLQLLGLENGLNKDVIGVRTKQLGQAGAIRLHEGLFDFTPLWFKNYDAPEITLDGDSTVKTVYGNQEGAAKGYNPYKKGAKSYNPLLLFASELKILVNSWFRTGSAYTSNGIVEMLKQTVAILPPTIKKVFFRADSGFFIGDLIDYLEYLAWNYLIKVKLKGLKKLLESQTWEFHPQNPDIAICKFDYRGKGWKKSRQLVGIRTRTDWIEVEFMGEMQLFPKYEYACYCSNLPLEPLDLHKYYQARATSETWIEQVKSQLMAGTTLTDNFHANDILWQLSVLAYNCSVAMRSKKKKVWRQEHATFRDWFIKLPGRLQARSRGLILHLPEKYGYKWHWLDFEQSLRFAT